MKSILVLILISFQALAQSQAPLSPLKNPPKQIQFKPQPTLPVQVSCKELSQHIQLWGQFRADADIAVAGYGEQLSNAVDNWVKILQPLEKSSVTIKEGYFAPVVEGSTSLQENIPMIYENSDFFDSHLKKVILPTLEKCLEEKVSNGSGRNN